MLRLTMQTWTRGKASVMNSSQRGFPSHEINNSLTVNVGPYPALRNIFITVHFCGNAVFVRGSVWLTAEVTDCGTENVNEQPESLDVPRFLVCRKYMTT